jgi:glycosyltransferase involved in cell wall biosynthesis
MDYGESRLMPTARVLYLTLNPNRVSTTVPTEGWLRLLPSRGLEPVVASREMGAFQAWVTEQGFPSYENALSFPSRQKPWTFLRDVWALYRIVKRHRIQLIHSNEQDVYPIGQYVARLCGIPIVVTVHFTMDRHYCQWTFAGPKQPARIFFISRGSLEACRHGVAGIIEESRWRLMYNGIDLERFSPDDARRQSFRQTHGLQMQVVLGVACALRPRKQIEHLIEAVVRANVPQVSVVVAGGPVPGDEAYADRLLADARARLGPRLILLGHVEDLRDFYNALDAFVNTSQEEACSISVMESLGCGTPVLGYPSKSVDDQVLPGGGEIVEQDDVVQLAARIRTWAADRDALAARRASARARAEEMFDIRTLAGDLWREYESLIGHTRA